MVINFLFLALVAAAVSIHLWRVHKKKKAKELRQKMQMAPGKLHETSLTDEQQLDTLYHLQLENDRDTVLIRSNNTDDLLLIDLFRHYYGRLGFLIQSLTVINDDTRTQLHSQEEIQHFYVMDAIVRDKQFIGRQAVVMMECATVDPKKATSFVATLTLEAKEEDDECLMARATITIPMLDILAFRSMPLVSTIMLSVDKMERKQKQAYFRYMLKEAIDTDADDLYTLDPVQLEILSLAKYEPARDLFFGHKYYGERRYYNALLHLENAYENLRADFLQLNDHWKEKFYEVCYMIGRCYCEMQKYQQAIYFLDIVAPLYNITYTTEYINALAYGGDVRANDIINKTIQNVQRQIAQAASNEQTLDPDLVKFYNLLKRRKGYVLVDTGQLDEAETLFQHLLKEPSNHDYALHELEYIKTLRQQRQGTTS